MDTSPRSLSIGLFCARWPPAHLGGTELQAARTARELAARGHRVHVFTRRTVADPRDEEAAGVTVHMRRTAPIAGLRLAGEICNGVWQARRVRTDVNLCYITLNSGMLGYALRRVYGTPFVIALQGLQEALPLPRSWRKRLERFLQVRADSLWIQSTGLIELAKREYEDAGLTGAWQDVVSRTRVIGNGVDLPEIPAGPMPPQRFIFVGRLVEEKALPTLIEAARQLPDVEVQLVGAGPLESRLRRLARGLRVEFLGRRSPDQIPSLLRRSRGLVLCSNTEGLPNVILESLAHGRPVIATPVGAIPELVEDGVNGCLVPQGAPEALAAAMRRLTDDRTWRRLATAARPSVERFAWPRFIRDVERELIETVDAHQAGAPGRS